MNNLHQHINFLLDEFAPYKKLKSKPWINSEILSRMEKRGKLLHKYCKTTDNDLIASQTIYEEYLWSDVN